MWNLAKEIIGFIVVAAFAIAVLGVVGIVAGIAADIASN